MTFMDRMKLVLIEMSEGPDEYLRGVALRALEIFDSVQKDFEKLQLEDLNK